MTAEMDSKTLLLEIDETSEGLAYHSSIDQAIAQTTIDLEHLNETIDSIQKVKNEADKIDYMLAASAGALADIIDIFVIRKSAESSTDKISSEWLADRIKNLAQLFGWEENKNVLLSEAVRFLENTFDVPNDQRLINDGNEDIFNIIPSGNYSQLLKNNPNLLGLFYSILYQFQNPSNFKNDHELISIERVDETSELIGHDIPSRLFAGFINWLRHLIFELADTSSNQNRGTGIPLPLWEWLKSLVLIQKRLDIPNLVFDQCFMILAINIYSKCYNHRLKVPQAIPAFINEMLVRIFYSTRRMIHYFSTLESKTYLFDEMWERSKPFGQPTVKRMLTVAHSTFCLIDLSDATLRLGILPVAGFFLRLNLIGIGRFTISLYGEGQRAMSYHQTKKDSAMASRKKTIVENYLEGLKILADTYDDQESIQFIRDFTSSDLYTEAFEQSITLAQKRKVPGEKILKNKSEIDQYFRGDQE